MLIGGRRIAEVTLLLSDMRIAHIGEKPGMGRAAPRVRFACLNQAQMAIHREPDLIGVGVILAIIFPPANWTQGERLGRFQRSIPATRAPILGHR